MRSLFMSLVVAMCLAFWLPNATAQVRVIVDVPANARWINTGLDVEAGESIEVTASGTWTDGSATSGPDGAGKHWPDNFFNLEEIGVCATCAKRQTPGWGALIGYIGNSPPAAGSYTSTTVLPEAVKIFLVGSSLKGTAPLSGRLWLAKNADAYSSYTVDNSGTVTATVTAHTEIEPENFFRFVGPTLCIRNLITAAPCGVPCLYAALLSASCGTTLASGTLEGVALYQCLVKYRSVDVCLLGTGIPK